MTLPQILSTLLVLLLGATALQAQQRVFQQGNTRVFYHVAGQHAVDLADTNQNGTPDQVEDAMTQTLAARALFVEVLGFPDPFTTKRFRTASFLDIHFRHKDVLKVNGVAYDELQRYKRPDDPPGTLSLCFNIATSVRPSSNLTPSHEFFHLIQYSTTYFKNGWFTEGTARWAEMGLGKGALGTARVLSSWPLSEPQNMELFQRRYDASEFLWNPLVKRCECASDLPASPALTHLQQMRYVDGSPVLKDLHLTGWDLMRDLLHELDAADDEVFQQRGYQAWLEKDQSSPDNNDVILQAVKRVVARRKP